MKALASTEIAVIASGRMTNEELWLTKQLVAAVGTHLRDIVPNFAEGDKLLLNADRNPNTTTAKMLKISGPVPGSDLSEIVRQVKNGRLKGLIVLAEDVSKLGLTPEDLQKLQTLIVVSILQDDTSRHATIVFPSAGFSEKRGSMINAKGRLQRLNRATNAPGEAREDWEILNDLIRALSGESSLNAIEDVFKQMVAAVPVFSGLSLSKIGDLGVQLDLPQE